MRLKFQSNFNHTESKTVCWMWLKPRTRWVNIINTNDWLIYWITMKCSDNYISEILFTRFFPFGFNSILNVPIRLFMRC